MADQSPAVDRLTEHYIDLVTNDGAVPHFVAAAAPVAKAAKVVADQVQGTGAQEGESAPAFRLRDSSGRAAAGDAASLAMVRDVERDVKIELGRAEMALDDVLKLQAGSVVVLDKLAGDLVDVVVNGELVARGEVVVLNDNFCVRVVELVGDGDNA